MLAYITGTLEIKQGDYVVIDVGGIGYKIFMARKAIDEIGKIGEKVKVYTYMKVREDDISIFGFISNEELRLFEILISVSGIGAKMGLTILSVAKPSEFVLAIISDDVEYLTQIPGIGAKTAKRVILELKDKMKKESAIIELKETTKNINLKNAIEDNTKITEAVEALQVLGYNKKEIEKAFEKLDKKNLTTEELIKKGLTILAM